MWGGGQGSGKAISSTQSHKVEVCNHVLSSINLELIVDTSGGQTLLTLAPLISLDCEHLQTNIMTNAVNDRMNLQCYTGAKRHSEKGEFGLVEKWEEK